MRGQNVYSLHIAIDLLAGSAGVQEPTKENKNPTILLAVQGMMETTFGRLNAIPEPLPRRKGA